MVSSLRRVENVQIWLINTNWKFVRTQPIMNVYLFIVYCRFKDFKIFVFIKQIGNICK